MAGSQRLGNRIDRWLLKRGFRKGWPLLTLNLIEARRKLAAPHLLLTGAVSAPQVSEWTSFISRRDGYRLFDDAAFPELSAVVEASRAVFERHRDEVTDPKAYNKPYFFNVLETADLRTHPVLADFALSRPVTAAAAGYLGQPPRLHSIGVFYSAVNDTVDGSQMYHVDGDALSQVKCFVNVWDVKPGGGAFTFLPKGLTPRRFRSGGLLKTLSDEAVSTAVPDTEQMVVTGRPGSGVFVDTSRCLHQGSRARDHSRLVFQFQYVPRPDALLAREGGRTPRGGHLLITRSVLDGIELANPDAMKFVD